MSYAVTDAVESDFRKELKVVEKLNEDVDQLASDARDCSDLCPEAMRMLDLAWFFTEEAIRETTGRCSAGCNGKSFCSCCHHFNELKGAAARVRR